METDPESIPESLEQLFDAGSEEERECVKRILEHEERFDALLIRWARSVAQEYPDRERA